MSRGNTTIDSCWQKCYFILIAIKQRNNQAAEVQNTMIGLVAINPRGRRSRVAWSGRRPAYQLGGQRREQEVGGSRGGRTGRRRVAASVAAREKGEMVGAEFQGRGEGGGAGCRRGRWRRRPGIEVVAADPSLRRCSARVGGERGLMLSGLGGVRREHKRSVSWHFRCRM